MGLFTMSRDLWLCTWPLCILSLRRRERGGVGGRKGNRALSPYGVEEESPWGKRLLCPEVEVWERMSGRYLTIYQALTGNEGNSRDLRPCLSLCKCGFPSPLPIDVSPLLGKTFTIAAKLWSAFSPTLLLPPAWSLLGGNVAYNGPRVNHLQVSPDKSSVFAALLPRVNSSCGDVPRVACGIWSAGPDGRQCAAEAIWTPPSGVPPLPWRHLSESPMDTA